MAIIISILTIGYASLGSFSEMNFTEIGNQPQHLIYFILWSALTATYFFYFTHQAFKKYHYTFKYQIPISLYIYLGILITPFIPYTETNPFLDDLHVFMAMSSSILYLIVMAFFLLHLKNTFPTITKKIETPFFATIQTLFFLVLYYGIINSIIEIALVISMAFLIEFLLKTEKV